MDKAEIYAVEVTDLVNATIKHTMKADAFKKRVIVSPGLTVMSVKARQDAIKELVLKNATNPGKAFTCKVLKVLAGPAASPKLKPGATIAGYVEKSGNDAIKFRIRVG